MCGSSAQPPVFSTSNGSSRFPENGSQLPLSPLLRIHSRWKYEKPILPFAELRVFAQFRAEFDLAKKKFIRKKTRLGNQVQERADQNSDFCRAYCFLLCQSRPTVDLGSRKIRTASAWLRPSFFSSWTASHFSVADVVCG